jgi:hypothetical protein
MSLPWQCLRLPHKLASASVVAFVGTAVGVNAQNVCIRPDDRVAGAEVLVHACSGSATSGSTYGTLIVGSGSLPHGLGWRPHATPVSCLQALLQSSLSCMVTRALWLAAFL